MIAFRGKGEYELVYTVRDYRIEIGARLLIDTIDGKKPFSFQGELSPLATESEVRKVFAIKQGCLSAVEINSLFEEVKILRLQLQEKQEAIKKYQKQLMELVNAEEA